MEKPLLLISLLLATNVYAKECGIGEKEFLELTYMSEEELKIDYCRAILFEESANKKAEESDLAAMVFLNEGLACSTYAKKLFKVLRKEYSVELEENIKCDEIPIIQGMRKSLGL